MLEDDPKTPRLTTAGRGDARRGGWLSRFPREGGGTGTSLGRPPVRPGADTRSSHYQEVKSRIHEQLLNRLNLERLSQVRREEAEPELRNVIGALLETEAERTPLSLYERESIVADVLNELFGLGPLESLLLDGEISDILVNRHDQVYVEREGRLHETDIVFQDDRHLHQIIERIVSSVGRRIDESSPIPSRCRRRPPRWSC